MNVISLAHARAKNQHQESSWSDDPFDLKGFVTGVTKVSDHERNLRDYALDMVGSYAKFKDDQYELALDMLSSPYQLEFARLYIESIDREIEWACYREDQTLNSDFLCAMLAMLKDNTPETRAKFAQVTTENILISYKNTLQELLDTACEEYYTNEMENAGYRCEQDMDHGDFHWRKF
jgi:hypothetical protein